MIDRACISLTSKCQFNCVYCHFDKHIDKNKSIDMRFEDLRRIFKNIKAYISKNDSTFKVGLVGSGEPLLRFDLIERAISFLEEIDKENSISLYVISNGAYCSSKMMQFFYEKRRRLKLCFSLDGYKEIHNECRKLKNGKRTFDMVLKTIDLYTHIFGQAPSVNATVHKLTIQNAEKVLHFFENNFSEVCFSRLVDEISPSLFISKAEFDSFIKTAMQTTLKLRQRQTKRKYDCTMYGQLCGVGRTNIFYDNGKIYPCGRFVGRKEFVLGNATDSLCDIENSMRRFTPCKEGECYFDENIARSLS